MSGDMADDHETGETATEVGKVQEPELGGPDGLFKGMIPQRVGTLISCLVVQG